MSWQRTYHPNGLPNALNTGGKTLEEVTNFPIEDDLSPPKDEAKPKQPGNADTHTPQRVPFVGIGGKVIRWVDAPEQDADPEETDLP